MGPGLLESVYEIVLAHALKKRGLKVERQVPVAIVFEGRSDYRRQRNSGLKFVENVISVH